MSMHAASRDLWRALKACSIALCAASTRELRRALTNYLLNYTWGMDKKIGDLDQLCQLLLALEYEHVDSAKALIAALAPAAISEIDSYDEWWRAELAGEHKAST